MQGFRKDRRGLRSRFSPLLPREDYKILHVYQLSDIRECVKISKPRMSRHARFWVAPSGFRTIGLRQHLNEKCLTEKYRTKGPINRTKCECTDVTN